MAAFQGLVMGVNTVLNTFMERQERRQLKKLNAQFGGVKNTNVNGCCGKSCATNGRLAINDGTDCVICYEDLKTSMTSVLGCGHTFHTCCIRQWFKYETNCPLCRKYI